MSEWKEIELSELINFGNGKKKPDSDGSIPIYGGNGILGYSAAYNYENETIIIGRVGAYCGSVYYENKPIWVSDNALAAKAKNGNSTKFLYYFLKNANLNQHAGGSSHPLVTQTLLNSLVYEICVDEIEQNSIASVLSSLDDKIDLLHRQNQTLEQMAETLFRQWFVEEADEEWEEVTLKSLCKVITKGTTPTSLKRQFVEVGINFIKVNCIDENGNFLYKKFNFIDDETHHVALKRSILQEDDLLYSIAGTIGRISEVTHEVLPANVNQALAILRVNTDIINPYYVKYSLKDPNITFDLHSKIVHAVQPNLSLGEIGSTLIPLPDKETRQKFNEVINPIQGKIKSNQTQIRTLTALRDTLLPKLMSGELRVQSHRDATFGVPGMCMC